MSSEVAIRCTNLGKAFQLFARREDKLFQALFGLFGRYYHKEHWVLEDLSFEVRRGECFGIIGRNGAGKTTLLQILCGITRASRGEMEVRGRVAPILALGAGFDTELTGRENVLIGGAILGLKRKVLDARMDSIAEFAEIGEYFEQPIRHYSSGMISRLAFAICAHVDADVLIVDEALSVGDQAFQAKCEAFIQDFARRGTLLIVSHSMGELAALCDRVMWIEDGKVRALGPAAEVTEAYLAETAPEPVAETPPPLAANG